MASIFTKIIEGEIPSYKIAEDDSHYAFLDIRPLTKGHTLVIPKLEVDYIFDLEDEVLTNLMRFAKRVALGIEKAIPCRRVAVAVIGLEVPHAHVHLVPIDRESDFFKGQNLKLTPADFESIAAAIRTVLENHDLS